MTLISDAISVAEIAHAGQARKYTGEPYIVHPAAVARHISRIETATESLIAAAWLHDVIEDSSITLDEIKHQFGTIVAGYVWDLTKRTAPSDGNRKTRFGLELPRIFNMSVGAKLIKAFDIIDNVRTITRYDPTFAEVYIAEKKIVLDAMHTTDVINIPETNAALCRAKQYIDHCHSLLMVR